ncbi:MAG: hypothetical protein ABI618_15600 [Nitrospirota bacterium]
MDWEIIGMSAISSGIFGGLIFLWLNHRLTNERNALDNEFELERDRIKNDFLSELIVMRTELNRVSANQQFQFTKLHEKRAEVIVELYQKMAVLKHSLYVVSNLEKGTEDHISRLEQASKEWEECDKFWVQNMIYFSPKLCDDLHEFSNLGRWCLAHQYGDQSIPIVPMPDQEQIIEKRSEQWEKLESASTDIMLKISNEFRLLLGMLPEEIITKN